MHVVEKVWFRWGEMGPEHSWVTENTSCLPSRRNFLANTSKRTAQLMTGLFS